MSRILLVLLGLMPGGMLVAAEAPWQVEGALTVDVFQAAHLYEQGAVFVDVREAERWRWGHIEGAVHLDLAGGFGDLAGAQWPRDLPLVIYCDSALCLRAPVAVRQAVSWGYRHVFYFREGYYAWQLADFPLGRGLAGEVPLLNAQAR